jgi:hypothetical protein
MKRILFDESLASGEDWDALIQIAKNSRTTTIGYLNEPLFNVNDGAHLRTTNKTRDLSREELERRMVVIRKNRSFFGEFLFNQHVAAYLLSYFSSRKGKLNHLAYTIGRCGVAPVAVVLARKAERQLSAFIGRRRTRARSSAKE